MALRPMTDDAFVAQLAEGIRLFNDRQFYECHDYLEDIWLQEFSDRQPLLQAIIQAAVAFHHFEHGRFGAARSMLSLSLRKLWSEPRVSFGVQVEDLASQLARWKSCLDHRISTGDAATTPIVLPLIRFDSR